MKAYIITHKRSKHFISVCRKRNLAINRILLLFGSVLGEQDVSFHVFSEDMFCSPPFRISRLHHLSHQLIFSLLKFIWCLRNLFLRLREVSAPFEYYQSVTMSTLSEIRSIVGDFFRNILRSKDDYLTYYTRLINIEAAHLECISSSINGGERILLICEDDLILKDYHSNLEQIFCELLKSHISFFEASRPYMLFLSDSYLPILYDYTRWVNLDGLSYKRTTVFRDSPSVFRRPSTDCMNCYMLNSCAATMILSQISSINGNLMLRLLPIDWKVNYLFLFNRLSIATAKIIPTPFMQGSLLG